MVLLSSINECMFDVLGTNRWPTDKISDQYMHADDICFLHAKRPLKKPLQALGSQPGINSVYIYVSGI